MQIDVIKIGDRQTKEGRTVTFRLHPHDDASELVNANPGSQWQMQLVPLDDNGNPESDGVQGHSLPSVREGAKSESAPSRSLAQRIGALCASKRFQVFLCETQGMNLLNIGTDEQRAAEVVRMYCGVTSRRDIERNSDALRRWETLIGEFGFWLTEPETA